MPGVGDRQRVGQRLGLFAFVLDFDEDAEVAVPRLGFGLADQVGGVLVVVGIEEAGEDDVVLQLAQLDRLALDHLLGVTRGAARGEREDRSDEQERGKQR